MSTGQFSSNRTYNVALDDALVAVARVIVRETTEVDIEQNLKLLVAICGEIERLRRHVRRDKRSRPE